jgi:energy-coupling factor transporter ATP-binding protein EcfA2
MIEILNLHHRYPDGTHTLKGINLTILKVNLFICGKWKWKTTYTGHGGLRARRDMFCINGDTTKKSWCGVLRMVFQDPESQIVGETVGEDLAFGPENMGLSTEKVSQRVEHALKVMGLEGLSEKPCYLLSGGEKRRLAIAGVLAMDPEIVLFDEPFSYLVPGTGKSLS